MEDLCQNGERERGRSREELEERRSPRLTLATSCFTKSLDLNTETIQCHKCTASRLGLTSGNGTPTLPPFHQELKTEGHNKQSSSEV